MDRKASYQSKDGEEGVGRHSSHKHSGSSTFPLSLTAGRAPPQKFWVVRTFQRQS